MLLNQMAALFDYLNDYLQTHEKALNDLLIEYGYENIYAKNLMLSEFHVIDCIGKNRLPNATFISKELILTKGAISKITAKLILKELIKPNQLENNKKEIYYTLTSQGKEAYEVHEKIHDLGNKKVVEIFNKYNKEELNTISRFLDDLLNEL
ncbi:MarR family transcriptional regulator [Desulfosporosinus fructosivorans]|uniref:MarR family transcriptional regulator n=2 Tax=Desulfosporosinus fructosivorans TaxID=2018669 RepID=A0A4Z0R3R1_9FIRM|nr:MarR family transcriptional regulator [Desulfosporosinus fructosivorans]